MKVCACLLMLVISACARPPHSAPPDQRSDAKPLPEIGRNTAPDDWIAVHFANGLSLSVPPGAKVVRPQGIDSNVLVVEGSGFTLDFDDYGAFGGMPNATLSGHPANIDRDTAPDCNREIVSVENGRSNSLMSNADGQDCHAAPGKARIGGHCVPGTGCAPMETIIASVRFGPLGPQQAIDPDFRDNPSVCTMPDEGTPQPG